VHDFLVDSKGGIATCTASRCALPVKETGLCTKHYEDATEHSHESQVETEAPESEVKERENQEETTSPSGTRRKKKKRTHVEVNAVMSLVSMNAPKTRSQQREENNAKRSKAVSNTGGAGIKKDRV